jgi:hypothetical protein
MRGVLSALIGVLILCSAQPGAAEDFEHQLKAEFIDRFIRFVDWPESEPAATHFIIGVYGRSPVFSHISEIAEQRLVKGRVAAVRRVSDLDDLASCQVVFISGSARNRLDEILERTAGLPVLTVADSEGFGARGVLINLYRDGTYLRFEINRGAVDRSGLKFSSQLLRLARLIDGE